MQHWIGPAVLVIALAGFATLAEAQTRAPPHYTVIRLPTLGGSQSNGYGGVTNNGWVSGDAELPGGNTEHAFVWRDGVMTDLGTVGGANSSAPSPVKDDRGLIVGQAQGSEIDPSEEYWGAAYTCTKSVPCEGWQDLQFGFLWQDGVMTKLPTLGGNNSSAFGVNNRGQVVGFAETSKKDLKNCVSPQKLIYKAVVYGLRGEIQQILPTFPGDAVAAATAINDRGDVVGSSGNCALPYYVLPGVHAVLWRNGSVFDLGNLGGKMNNVAQAINNAGQIAGYSDLPGDTLDPPDIVTHAALWQKGAKPTDLGTLPGGKGDVFIIANDINSKGQVVGSSCDANFNCRAWLWENGVMIDLNSLVPTGSLYLTWGSGINDRGEIAGSAFDPSTGDIPGFLAIPAPAAQIAGDSARKMVLPENIRASLQRRLRIQHFGDRPTAQQ
jgi:probable HAF family extracellular repeat protein